MNYQNIACVAALLGTISTTISATEIDFIDAAEVGKTASAIVVRLNSDDILVFRDTATYVLHGRRLIVVAPAIRIDTQFTIRQFDDSDTTPPKAGVAQQPAPKPPARRTEGRTGANGETGNRGNKGADGDGGKDAPLIVLDIQSLTGIGKLIINNSGAKGGKGQTGSQGGTGGAGEPGAEGSESVADCKHGGADGGYGGRGGEGGQGGTGGPGGKGGTVRLSKVAMQALAPAGPLEVVVVGGAGGERGDRGVPGIGGAGGPGGAGTRVYCKRGDDKPSLGNGQQGDLGDPGPLGSLGIVMGL